MTGTSHSHVRYLSRVPRVKKRTIVALSTLPILGLGVAAAPALAYPPGMGMTVSATPKGSVDHHRHQLFQVTVKNVKPGCSVRISAGYSTVKATAGRTGTASGVLSLDSRPGKAVIVAKTLKCKGSNEVATTKVTISPGKAYGPPWVRRGHDCVVHAERWIPRHKLVLVATNGRITIRKTVMTDRNGAATVHFTPTKAGAWAVILVQNGHNSAFTLNVR